MYQHSSNKWTRKVPMELQILQISFIILIWLLVNSCKNNRSNSRCIFNSSNNCNYSSNKILKTKTIEIIVEHPPWKHPNHNNKENNKMKDMLVYQKGIDRVQPIKFLLEELLVNTLTLTINLSLRKMQLKYKSVKKVQS